MFNRPTERFGLRADLRRRSERRVQPAEANPGRPNSILNESAEKETAHPIIRLVSHGVASKPPAGTTIEDALEFADQDTEHLAMLFYPEPDPEQIAELGTAWSLHPVMLEDILLAGQRPKIERYGDVLFLVVRSARYVDELEEVQFAEFHILVRRGAVAVICQDSQWLDGTETPDLDEEHPFETMQHDNSILANVNLLTLGVEAVVYRVIDEIVDRYEPVLRGLEIDKEQVERQVFGGDTAVAERIYRLSQEVVDMQQTVSSMSEVLTALKGGHEKYQIPPELQKYLDDVADHLAKAATHSRDLREELAQILTVNSTLVAQRQNEDMKKISGWAAILFAPTLVGAIYGMNFDVMPELHWAFGYPMALGLMLVLTVGLYIIFKRSKWM
ncbi:magnesium and cobalt transport protein CorA [Gulosibacter molinativorax]|uniref:Magnesium and cobalt transport protein CorA n=1 Tax=Gulosibacter molinativorax TaxID=256821 RepID=A0ABT7C9K8_9MICO|nr:magnesium and cobalt transport protein CorA [Gulosibacter molinativorax]MDJ1371906.1 magnesium and cobalt transport protein CorA [Gulosibacter molinativorax]QUY62555.1 MIT family metal ion transporter CorA [Gulosibacter molinativorax]